MNSDHFFCIGTSHEKEGKPCEDYALSGKFKIANGKECNYAVVSDGCSSSEYTDIGSRVLCHKAVESLKVLAENDIMEKLDVIEALNEHHESLSSHTLLQAISTLESFDCKGPALHATLLTALSNDTHTLVNMFGDGCVVVKEEDKITLYEVEYDGNAPHYEWYNYKFEKDEYLNLIEGRKKHLHTYIIDEDGTALSYERKECDFLDNTFFVFENKNLISVTVASDGLTTFSGKSPSKTLDPFESHNDFQAVSDSCSFKNFSGNFVKRRMLSMLKKYKKEQVTHYDDVSVATTYLGDTDGDNSND